MFRNAPTLCGRLFAVSAANAAKQASACPHAGAAAANAAARKTPSPTPPAAVCGFAASAAPPTIFDKLGGKAAVTAAVDKFYEKVLADPTVNVFFNGTIGPAVGMQQQKRKQIQFLSFALGGPEGYKGKDMFEAHKHLPLKEEHFNAIAGHLIATLKELGVQQQYIDEAISVVATTKDAVLGEGQYAGRK